VLSNVTMYDCRKLRFNRKIIVVKYGGSAMVDEQLKKQYAKLYQMVEKSQMKTKRRKEKTWKSTIH
jgi:hypothetical protein